ncbi:hypothetical protein CUJ84_Chr003828 [Rhizobium leguminosarum]|uniref:Uncharacterized protein n=1 Tax=Rhizobium leguminosarum TaxID=384 RepID=A0A2K9Z7F6_RHILE|nr:hypothetical protein CUJ84_Chr003828 [Rhizobium leguminosarum]
MCIACRPSFSKGLNAGGIMGAEALVQSSKT